MILLPTDLTTIHYAPAGQAVWCDAMQRVYAAKDAKEVTFDYPFEHITKKTDVVKVTCPECCRRIIVWANYNLNRWYRDNTPPAPSDDAKTA